MTYLQATESYRVVVEKAKAAGCLDQVLRRMAMDDLFFLLVHVLHRSDCDREWVYDRCREYAAAPDGYIDLWFRESYKTSIITFAGIIQNTWRNPERTTGIFSNTRPAAKKFLRQIKVELETNEQLKYLGSDVFWADPKNQAPKWSEDDGLVVKRKGNPKESTIEAWGLTDGQPLGPHFSDLHYEDVVTPDVVRTPDSIKRTYDAWRNSLNLGMAGGRRRGCATLWHYDDPALKVIGDGIFKARKWTATKNGKMNGEPWIWTRAELAKRFKDNGPYLFSCNYLLDPVQESLQSFRAEWLRYWRADRLTGLNRYLLVDPASSKKKGSDFTAMMAVGLGADRNYYVIDWIRDRLSLNEKGNILFRWHQQYEPQAVGYEQYGLLSDIEHFQDRMARANYRFTIKKLGGRLSKAERIARLVPLFADGRIYIPEAAPHGTYDGETVDVTKAFVNEEYLAYPYAVHDDVLDNLARVIDDELGADFPQGSREDPLQLGGTPGKVETWDPLRWGLEER